MPAQDTSFSRLVSLACHDLRTPLATVTGFAKTMVRMEGVDEKIARYLGMIDAAGGQLAELLEELALASRIEGGRWDPIVADHDSLQLALAAAEPLGDAVEVSGEGERVAVARQETCHALEALARCALRHGGLDAVGLRVDGASITISPVDEQTAAICLGRDLRDFPAAVAVRVIEALGGATGEQDDTLVVDLPLAPSTA
jgi:light-regulated signal transduction histidine kinase (bacteriophytochrome)